MDVRDPEKIGAPEVCVARSPAPRDFNEAQGFAFADCWRNSMAMDAVIGKVVKRDGQPAVILARMISELDFQSRQDAVPGRTEDTKGGRL